MHVMHERACVGRNLGGTAEYLRPFLGMKIFLCYEQRERTP